MVDHEIIPDTIKFVEFISEVISAPNIWHIF